MADLAKIVEDLSNLTVLEAAELSKMLEEKWAFPPLHRWPLLPQAVLLLLLKPLKRRLNST
jgi:ribosomal protein L7/L12